MTVDGRVLPHQRVHVRNRNENPDLPAGERLGNRDLVEVAGVVIVDGCPEPFPQVAQVAGCIGRPVDGRQLSQRSRRKVGLQTALNHRLPRDSGQSGPVAF